MGDLRNKIVLITGASSGNTKTMYNVYCILYKSFDIIIKLYSL